jgi:hypothetical protein
MEPVPIQLIGSVGVITKDFAEDGEVIGILFGRLEVNINDANVDGRADTPKVATWRYFSTTSVFLSDA